MEALTEAAIWIICLSPIWGAFLGHGWEYSIRPRLIPAAEIKDMADRLVRDYGQRAEEIAFIEEDRAWRYGDSFQQGKWHRVRKELWRRHEAGEWCGPEY